MNHLQELEKLTAKQLDLGAKYIKLDDAVEYIVGVENANKENVNLHTNGIDELKSMFNSKSIIKYFFTRPMIGLAMLILIALNLDMILFMFNYEFKWLEKMYVLLKIAFVIPIAVATSQTFNYAFKDLTNNTEQGVPSPRTVVYYITQSWLLYILLSTGLTIYNFNLESIGIENLSDFVATFNSVTSLLALTQFILWRWFRNYYQFIFSTINDEYDSNSTFNILTPAQKTYVSITLIFGLLWVAKDIFIAFLSR